MLYYCIIKTLWTFIWKKCPKHNNNCCYCFQRWCIILKTSEQSQRQAPPPCLRGALPWRRGARGRWRSRPPAGWRSPPWRRRRPRAAAPSPPARSPSPPPRGPATGPLRRHRATQRIRPAATPSHSAHQTSSNTEPLRASDQQQHRATQSIRPAATQTTSRF